MDDENIIKLPNYWTHLVDSDTITVQLTSIGKFQKLYVKEIVNNEIVIGNFSLGKIRCFYLVQAERKDVGRLEVEK